MRTFRRLLNFVKSYVFSMLGATSLGLATVLSSIGLMATSAYIIASAALHPPLYTLQLAITGVRFFGISRGVFRYFERLISHNVTFKILGYMRVWFYEKIEPLVPAKLTSFQSGDLLSRIVSDIETLENLFVRVLYPPFVFVFVLISVSIFMALFSFKLVIVLGIFMLGGAILIPILSYSTAKSDGRMMLKHRGDLYKKIVDTTDGLADILVFGYQSRQIKHIDESANGLMKTERKMGYLEGVENALILLVSSFGAIGVLILAIKLAEIGQIKGVMIAVLSLTALTAFEAIIPLPGAAELMESIVEAGNRLFEIVDQKPAVVDPPRPAKIPEKFEISMKDVTFSYSPGTPVLKNVTFNVGEGGKIAVVGPSGAGKSTIANLLVRFWDYDTGSIKIGGTELKSLSQHKVRSLVSLMTQRTYLFTGTIKENLLLAKPDATDEEIIKASKLARLHEFVLKLPEGYDTPVGEYGEFLSGGERQRVALARIILKSSPILVLDEPTSNLDPVTERAILDDIFEHLQEKTIIFITHRLSHMELMDEIVVLKNGEIVEKGKHRDLLRLKGLYWKMWSLQQEILIS